MALPASASAPINLLPLLSIESAIPPVRELAPFTILPNDLICKAFSTVPNPIFFSKVSVDAAVACSFVIPYWSNAERYVCPPSTAASAVPPARAAGAPKAILPNNPTSPASATKPAPLAIAPVSPPVNVVKATIGNE